MAHPTKKATPTKKKEGDAHTLFVNQQSRGQASYAKQPSYSVNLLPPIQSLSYNGTLTASQAQANNFRDNRGARIDQKKTKLDLIPISYTELLPRLLQNQLIVRVPMEPHKLLFSKW